MRNFLTILVTTLMLGLLSSCVLVNENEIMFINSSDISLSYDFLTDNIDPQIIISDYMRVDFSEGYDYTTKDGSELHRFIKIERYGNNPVMAYYRVNNINNDVGELFGIKLGFPSKVEKNKTLGIDKSYSLGDYLIELGFNYNYEKTYTNETYYNNKGFLVQWQYFVKEDIFINIALETNAGLVLDAFEIGLNVGEVYDKLGNDKSGYLFTVENDLGLIYNFDDLNNSYQVGYPVKLKMLKPNNENIPKLFINDNLIGDFEIANKDLIYYYEIIFFMPSYDIEVEVRV